MTTTEYLKRRIEELGIKETNDFNAESFCKELNMSVDFTIYALTMLYLNENKKLINLRDQNSKVIRRNEFLEECLDSAYNGNGRLKQMALVQSGMPIANSKKKCLSDLKLRLYLGQTDKELMEEYKISRTTLWRWKKEIEEEEQKVQGIINKNSKNW